jgi:gliding motility-associated-like protein
MLFFGFTATAQLAMPDNVCIGATKHYYVDPNPIPGSTYTWRIDGVIQLSSTINEIDITWNTLGTYILDVQELSVAGCPGPLKTGQVFVSDMISPAAFTNSPVCVGDSIILSSQFIIGANYHWTGPNGYNSSDQNSVISFVSESDQGTYTLVVSANGCTSDTLNFFVIVYRCNDLDFNIPEGYSPNGDGINDFFVIRGIENYPANSIVIFNRWGNKVFEASPYQNTWGGKCTLGFRVGGDELPVGTYFYLLNLGDGSAIIKGTIYLNR